jgi:flagellar hook-length control protein FliK
MKVDLALWGNPVQASSNNLQSSSMPLNFLNMLQSIQIDSTASLTSEGKTMTIEQLFSKLKEVLSKISTDLVGKDETTETGDDDSKPGDINLNIETWFIQLTNLINKISNQLNVDSAENSIVDGKANLTDLFTSNDKLKIFFSSLNPTQIKELEKIINSIKDTLVKNDSIKFDPKLIEFTKAFEEYNPKKNSPIQNNVNHKLTIVEKVVEVIRELQPNKEVKQTEIKQVINILDKFSTGQQLNRIQQFSIFTQTRGNELNTENLIKQFENILSSSIISKSANLQKLVVKLYPESLGSLRIEILQNTEGITARIQASTQQVKQLIDANLHTLKHSLAAQNLNVEKFEVTQAMNQLFEKGLPDRENLNQQNQNAKQQQQNSKEEETEKSFESFLNELNEVEGDNIG